MIEKVWITGDTHRDFTRFRNYSDEDKNNPNLAVIILGDAGINYTLDEQDSQIKNKLSKLYKFRIYCVRGNHEARPQNVENMTMMYDRDVNGEVYYEEKWPNIRYFRDFSIYYILNYKIGVIGGAYSVDKWYRLQRGATWFENEQLNDAERMVAGKYFQGEKVDFMLTHTSPISWEPTDLFLGGIDQSKVDKTMELFLQEIRENLDFNIWLFAHYHTDRIERPYVEQFFKDTENIDDIWYRWQRYEDNGELDWWLAKSPNFYQGT